MISLVWIITIIICIILLLIGCFLCTNHDRNITTHTIDGYTVLEIHDLLSTTECEDLIEFSTTQSMVPSSVADYINTTSGRKVDDTRKSTNYWLTNAGHPVAEKLSQISAELTNIPPENQEMLQVVKYEAGGTFFPAF